MLLLVGLLLVGMGTGGIKPCVATFGGDQFHLPEQAKQQTTFFSIFYWAHPIINHFWIHRGLQYFRDQQ